MLEEEASRKAPRQKEENWLQTHAPTLLMFVVTVFVLVVAGFVLWHREPVTVVIQSENPQADFNATSAIAYADRVARIAELAVGTILTLAVGLAGFSWLSNNARVERDRQDLAEHKTDLAEQLTRRLRTQARNYDLQLQSVARELEGAKADLRSYTDGHVRILESQISKQQTVIQAPRRPWVSPREIRDLLESGSYDVALEKFDQYLKETARAASLRHRQPVDNLRPILELSEANPLHEWRRRDPVARRLHLRFLEEVLDALPNAPLESIEEWSGSIEESMEAIIDHLHKEIRSDQLSLPGVRLSSVHNFGQTLITVLSEIRNVIRRTVSSDAETPRVGD